MPPISNVTADRLAFVLPRFQHDFTIVSFIAAPYVFELSLTHKSDYRLIDDMIKRLINICSGVLF